MTHQFTIPAVIMLPPEPSTPAEVWVAQGKRAACRDLIDRLLASADLFGPIWLLADWEEDRQALAQPGVEMLASVEGDFHFGRVLAEIIQQKNLTSLAYFGGASAPLVTQVDLRQYVQRVQEHTGSFGIVNNYHSTDWGIFTTAQQLVAVRDRLPSDNPLGWVLHHEAGFEIQSCPANASSRADIDTPADLIMLRGHPAVGPNLDAFIAQAPAALVKIAEQIRALLRTPASTLALIGRASPDVQLALDRSTQIWVRAFIEERGMVASHRLAHGEVRSIIGAMIEAWGEQRFVEQLAGICDGALWDTRVWMAHTGGWPSPGERFAADLGWLDQVSDERLKRLTTAILSAPIPILAGGYGVVSGGLYAMLETLNDSGDYQPSK